LLSTGDPSINDGFFYVPFSLEFKRALQSSSDARISAIVLEGVYKEKLKGRW